MTSLKKIFSNFHMDLLGTITVIFVFATPTVKGVRSDLLNQMSQETDLSIEHSRLGYVYKARSFPLTGLGLTVMELVPTLESEDDHLYIRHRRAVPTNVTKLWGENIPYVLHSSFRALGTKKKEVLKRAMKFISENLCVNFVDETSRYRARSTTWLPRSKYPDGNFIMVKHSGQQCRAHVDLENTTGQHTVEPCDDFKVNLHEMLHMLRGNHMHQGSQRDKYVTINKDNINPVLMSSYVRWDSTSQEYFEPFSALMYGPLTWTTNRLETWTPIRDDIAESDVSISKSPVEFWELNTMYRCAERFCQPKDCGPGYLARVKGVCSCVCPREYDPATDCHFHIDGPTQNLTWPSASFSLFSASNANDSCPDGFDGPNLVKFKTLWGGQDWQMKRTPQYYHMPWPWAHLPICSRSRVSRTDWNSWPDGGDFCVIKPKRGYCRGDFSEYTVWVRGEARPIFSGNVGDFRYSGSDMTIKLCCRGSVLWGWSLNLPNSQPFRLISGGSCPVVDGMREYQTILLLSSRMTPRKWGNGPKPWVNIFKDQIQLRLCYYMPPEYGCNMEIALDSVESSITLVTPGYRTVRDANRRCFYNFLVPDGAKIKITFNDFDLHEEDKMYLRRFHKWQTPHPIDRTSFPYEVVSEKSYLALEWWSSYQRYRVTNKGVNFTATILLPESSCYNETSRGAEYSGEHNYSETFEECLHWADTTDCVDFPSESIDAFWLLNSGNNCRNPDGLLNQPWCYTYKNGTNCHKRYCDVCNYKVAADVIKNCSALLLERPDFCTSSLSKYGCFKACNMQQPDHPNGTCGSPPIPLDGRVVGSTVRSSYRQGEHVEVRCSNPRDPIESSMKCTAQGWTVLTHACSANYTDSCPYEWTHHGTRCFRYFTSWMDRRQAEAVCRSYGTSGTLFQVKDVVDQVMLRRFRYRLGDRSVYVHGMWISGERNITDQRWYFTDTADEMRYYNWTHHAAADRTTGQECIKMTAEYSWAQDAGAWKTKPCDDITVTAPFVCQTYVKDAEISDRSDKCQEVLARLPYFCNSTATAHQAAVYCSTSCGRDNPNVTDHCVEPVSSTYIRTSGSSSVIPGQAMSFTCRPGMYKTGGQSTRACGLNGTLLGPELVCEGTPQFVDVKVNSLRKRLHALKAYTAYLLDNSAYRVPIKGKITKWYYYCKKNGNLTISVFNKSSNTNYSHVGTNNFRCEAGYKREFNVLSANQISANVGDVIALRTAKSDVLNANLCDGAMHEVMINKLQWAVTARAVTSLTSFPNSTCMVPSFGYRIVP